MKKTPIFILALLLLTLTACTKAEDTPINAAAMNGPTGMGIAQLNSRALDGSLDYPLSVTFAGSPDQVSGGLISGDIQIAAVPVNLASVLYNKTEGQVLTAAVNTLGVLYVVEKGESIQSFGDLAGKKILAAGQGSTPEYILNYLIEQNGLAGQADIEYAAEHAEAVTQMAAGNVDVIIVPEPFVTTALSKIEGARIALDITEEWSKVSDAELVQGCLVVRRDFAEKHPKAVESFLKDYAESAAYAVERPAETAALIESYGIMGSAQLAEKAIPNCNIVCVTGEDMQTMVSGMLSVLHAANPKSVGGELPGEDMYYMG